jgi:hypothetical protein
MAVNADPQLSLIDDVLEDEDLEQLLDDWTDAKAALVAPRKRYALVNDQVKAMLEELELDVGEYRCGKFRIRITRSESKQVAFERTSTKRISIKLFGDDE